MGGGVTKEKGILVNIFIGIIAEGVVSVVKEVGPAVSLVVRPESTNVKRGKRILNKSGLNVIAADSLAGAAQKMVEAVPK
jgi:succinyl-CoA synthetase beta subunit